MNATSESKKLAIRLRAEEDHFITGEADLNETLEETERLFNKVRGQSGKESITANELMPDSDLMKLQTRLAKRCAKFYKPDSLVFNATEFAMKLKLYYDQTSVTQDTSRMSQQSERENEIELIWLHLGNEAKKLLYTVPSFTFIHGTFDPDPVEVVKKKRKMREKDKVGKATKPESTTMTENTDNQDQMIKEAERVLGILAKVLNKTKVDKVCLYEFTIDPDSFGRTIENLFILSLLVKEKCVKIVEDRKGLPWLCMVPQDERNQTHHGTNQSIISIGIQEWKKIVQTFKLEKAVIPPRRSARHT